MGIDKSNVRYVIHWDIPESVEAYFQEAGRAGRDGKQSYAVLMYNNKDIQMLKDNFELEQVAPLTTEQQNSLYSLEEMITPKKLLTKKIIYCIILNLQ